MICLQVKKWQFVYLFRICNLHNRCCNLLKIQCHFRKNQFKTKMTIKRDVRETRICSMTMKNYKITHLTSIQASKLIVKYWISINLNKFLESFNLAFWSLIAFRKNCSKSSYSAVYDLVISSFLLIHAFSRAKNVSMRLKSNEYEDKRAKMISTASHIWMSSSFQ
jgi:hypothetical protein